MLEAADPPAWPQYFGVAVQPNAAHSGNFDLSVVYNPPGGPTGVPGPVVLESLPDLSLNTADSNYAPTQINALSAFIKVPPGYVPPATPPSGFPVAPTMLPNSGTVDLQDSVSSTYLTVQVVNPLAWPPSFGVLSQDNLANPDQFNLLVVYDPPSGGIGVPVPVVVEQFDQVSLDTAAGSFASGSHLLAVTSFEQEPNPALSARELMSYDAREAVPVITLAGTLNGITTGWNAQPDLLEFGPEDSKFVVEIERDGTAHLRFGDNTNGLRPESGMSLAADYRIGNGAAGNVGAESLVFLAAADARIQSCTNPMPATGGIDPETPDQIRRRAPQAFMTQERAVTMADYAALAEANTQVDRAVATLRWTGSWYTVFITAEPRGAGSLTAALRQALCKYVERYRLAGQDLDFESPQYVPLQITLEVCVLPDYFRSDVEQALLQVLGSGILPDGRKGLFYPDNFTFGQKVYLSPIYAAARKVAGVSSVRATVFGPQGVSSGIYLANGEIPLGPFQIAQMDNDRSLPNHGRLTLKMEGGK